MAGITRYGCYLPYYSLKLSTVGGGRGNRSVAGYDEDSVSMAVEAGRDVLRGTVPDTSLSPDALLFPDTLLFATTSPPYAEKLNAATLACALNLPSETRSLELGACSRMGLSALLLGLDLAEGGSQALVCASDVVTGAPGSLRESSSGDGAAAFVTGSDENSIAVLRGRASATTEVVDVWRLPDDAFARQWEERFGASVLKPIIKNTLRRALNQADLTPSQLTHIVVDAANPRVAAAIPGAISTSAERLNPQQLSNPLSGKVGRAGVANIGLGLAAVLDKAEAGDTILLVSAVDGCDVLILEVTDNIKQGRPLHSVSDWLSSQCEDVSYHEYLKWRGIMPFEAPRRPDPERPAAPASNRSQAWKMAFVGGRCLSCEEINLPAQRVCVHCGATDQVQAEPYADIPARVATYTLDHLAYSLKPPVLAAVVDFEKGGRISCELTDVDADKVEIGTELEMTFRRLYTGQGIHNYFWKARPKR